MVILASIAERLLQRDSRPRHPVAGSFSVTLARGDRRLDEWLAALAGR